MTIKSKPVSRPANASKLQAMLSSKNEIDVEFAHQDGVVNRFMTKSRVCRVRFLNNLEK